MILETRTHPPCSGIDFLLRDLRLLSKLSQQKVAMLSNQRTLTYEAIPSAVALQQILGKALVCLLTPEHGWSGSIAEGIKVPHSFEDSLNIPIYSLYGGNQGVHEFDFDVLIIDLQDVGLRCYTYAATCTKFIETLKDQEVIVCDRPNPLGSDIKGPALDPQFRSLVAYLDVPFQHGKSMGELLSTYGPQIISHQRIFQPYQDLWTPPSPNLPSWDAVLLYPTLVLLEGTNISEGRGTSFPFTSLGAPDLKADELIDFLNSFKGIKAEPFEFIPQSGKLIGKFCQGARLYVTNHQELEALQLGFELVRFLKETYPRFEWVCTNKGYFIDSLLGTDGFRKGLS